MTSESRHFRLGLFVLVALAIGAGAIGVLGAGALFRKKILVETYIDESVVGLDVGAPIRYRGVQVGQLEEIGFIITKYGVKDSRIRLVLGLFSDRIYRFQQESDPFVAVRKANEDGMRIRLASQGLTGGVYLEVELMDPKEHPAPTVPWTPELPYLPSIQSTGTRLTTHVENILEKLEKIKFGEISTGIVKVLEDLDKVVLAIDPAMQDVRKLSADASVLVGDFRKTLVVDLGKDLHELTARLRETVDKDVSPALKSVHAAGDRLPATFDRLEATLDRLTAVLRRVDRFAADQRGPTDDVMENLKAVSQDLRELSGQMKRYPAQTLLGEAPPRGRTENK